jgi:hypothetical protein
MSPQQLPRLLQQPLNLCQQLLPQMASSQRLNNQLQQLLATLRCSAGETAAGGLPCYWHNTGCQPDPMEITAVPVAQATVALLH